MVIESPSVSVGPPPSHFDGKVLALAVKINLSPLPLFISLPFLLFFFPCTFRESFAARFKAPDLASLDVRYHKFSFDPTPLPFPLLPCKKTIQRHVIPSV